MIELVCGIARESGELTPDFRIRDAVNEVIVKERWIAENKLDGRYGGGTTFHRDYPPGPLRYRKYAEILEILLNKQRSQGGSRPETRLRTENKIVVVTGPPASGKSTVSQRVADRIGAVIVDPDDAKQHLPEYRNGMNTKFVHEESSEIAKGRNGLLRIALDQGWNIVLPTIGADPQPLKQLCTEVTKRGYSVWLLAVLCETEIAAVRSLGRLLKTGRYVELKYILADVGNKPAAAYNQARKLRCLSGYAHYSTRRADEAEPIIKRKNFVCDLTV